MKHKPIHNLKHWAHPPKAGVAPPTPKVKNVAKAHPHQKGNVNGPLIGKKVPPANVSKPKMRKD